MRTKSEAEKALAEAAEAIRDIGLSVHESAYEAGLAHARRDVEEFTRRLAENAHAGTDLVMKAADQGREDLIAVTLAAVEEAWLHGNDFGYETGHLEGFIAGSRKMAEIINKAAAASEPDPTQWEIAYGDDGRMLGIKKRGSKMSGEPKDFQELVDDSASQTGSFYDLRDFERLLKHPDVYAEIKDLK